MNTAHLRRTESSGSPARVLLILGSVAVIGCLLVGVFMVWMLAEAQAAPVTAEDRGYLFPVAEVHSVGDEWTIRTASEKYSKVRYREQHVELAYEYVHPEEDKDLKVHSRIIVLPTAEEAGVRAAALIRDFQEGTSPLQTLEDSSSLYAPREDIVYQTRTLGAATVGHCLVHKQDRCVLLIRIEGDAADTWSFVPATKNYLDGFGEYILRFE